MADQMQILQRLARLLDDEAQAIRAGDLHRLARLPEGKAPLVAALEARVQTLRSPERGEAEALAALRVQAVANQRQLSATLKGLRAALRRLDGLRRAGRSLQSYDASGRPQTIGMPDRSLERRA